jgi:Bacterial protein of unknown function (DUF885)
MEFSSTFKIIKVSLILCLSIHLISCDSASKNEIAKISIDSNFKILSKKFIDQYFITYPAFASSQGFHDYDSALVINTAERIQLEMAFTKAWTDSLKLINYDALNDNNKIDYKIIENQLQSIVWYNQTFKSFEWDPSQYNISSDLFNVLNNKNLSNEIKTILATKKIEKIDAYYTTAMDNMVQPTIVHTELAIDQLLGGIAVFKALKDSINLTLNDDAVKKSMLEKVSNAENKTIAFVDFLKLMLKDMEKYPEKSRDFRIGKKLFEEKFMFDIGASESAEVIYEKACERKKTLTGEMYQLSEKLWNKYFAKC